MENDSPEFQQAKKFADEFAATAQALETQYLEALFQFYSTGQPGEALRLSDRMKEVYSSRKSFASLTRWIDQVDEPLLRRRLASLRQRFIDYQGDRELQKRLAEKVEKFLKLGWGQPIPLLYRHPVDCNQFHWPMPRQASLEQATLLAEIFDLRARLTEERGISGAMEFDPEQHIQDTENFLSIPQVLAELRLETEAAYTDLVQRPERLEPVEEMNEAFPRERSVDVVLNTLRAIGFDLDRLPIHLYLDARAFPGQFAFRFPIRLPDEIRVLVHHEPGPRGAELLLHELGHAVYTALVEQELWEFRAPASICMTEAIGQLFARLARIPDWFGGSGLPPETIQRHLRFEAEQDLSRLRIHLLLAHFEREARGQKVEALEQLWCELSASYLKVEPRPGLYLWASVMDYALHPQHLQNLVLAELIAAHLWIHYSRQLGSLHSNEAFGRRMKNDIFRHGARYPWPQLLLKITGRRLSSEGLVRDLLERLNSPPAQPQPAPEPQP